MNFKGKIFFPGLILLLATSCAETRRDPVEVQKVPENSNNGKPDGNQGNPGNQSGNQNGNQDSSIDGQPNEQVNGGTNPGTGNSGVTPDGTPNTGGQVGTGGTGNINQEHLKITGLSAAEFSKGKTFVNNWKGQVDEIPSNSTWHVKSVRGSANSIGVEDPQQPNTGGGVVARSSYESNIKSILDKSCVSCHRPGGSQGGIPLNSFSTAKNFADLSVDRVLNGSMPPGRPLSAADKDAMKEWKAAGYLEKLPSSNNNGGAQPGNNPPSNNDSQEIRTFRIPAGTGSGAWNTAETEMVVKVGVKFVIHNDDTVTHQWHTNGSPCLHGKPIPPGGKEECTPSAEYSGPTLYDHISNGKFYIKAVK